MVSVATIIEKLIPSLNAASLAELSSWTETELYQFADEALKALGRAAAVFITRTPLPIAAGDSAVTLPSGHAGTLHASFNGAILRPANDDELTALDAGWQTASGTPKRFCMDTAGLAQLRLYKIPTVAGSVDVIHGLQPADVTRAAPNVSAPAPIGLMLRYSILGAARRREGDECMPDVSAHFDELLKLFGSAARAYWGGGQ